MKLTFKQCFVSLFVFYCILLCLSCQLPFFQDNILFSAKIPYHFYNSGFFSFPLPVHLDTGYGPIWAWLMALSWKLFGIKIWVGHLICFPILVATAWFYLKIALYFIPENKLWMAAVLLIAEPTYLAQSTMVGPDILLVMGFMGGLYSIIYNKKYVLILLCLIISLTSVRGAILTFLLCIHQLIFYYFKKQAIHVELIIPYFIAAIFFFGWMLFHYQTTGYLLVNAESSWGQHHQLANFETAIKNVFFTIWRFIDFGRLFLWLALFLCVVICFKTKKPMIDNTKILLCWAFIPVTILVLILCVRTNPILHRYFMMYFLLIGLLLIYMMLNYLQDKPIKPVLLAVVLGLTTGHLWVYPEGIAKGWDASLAHLPYFKVRQQMLHFIKEENIQPDKITTTFPNLNGTYFSNLSNKKWNFIPKHKVPIQQASFIMQSNVMNDFSNQELDLLKSDTYQLVKEYKQLMVYMRLYKNLNPIDKK